MIIKFYQKFNRKYYYDLINLQHITIACDLHSTQVRRYFELRSTDTGVDYVTYVPKIENNTIKIGHFIHKCKFSTFIIVNGCRRRINRNSIKVIISVDLQQSQT